MNWWSTLYYFRHMADNKVFFQHPDLMRALSNHETVMQLMINTLNKAQHQTAATADMSGKRRSSVASDPQQATPEEAKVSVSHASNLSCVHWWQANTPSVRIQANIPSVRIQSNIPPVRIQANASSVRIQANIPSVRIQFNTPSVRI